MSPAEQIRDAAFIIALVLGAMAGLVLLLAFLERSVLARRRKWRR